MRTPRALVLGGGVAGIAAALALRGRGWAVHLLEAHGWLGGRVFSPPDRGAVAAVDNGPHVMLGCYDHMRALLRELSSEDAFAREPALAVGYVWPDGRRGGLRLPRLPVPLAMPWALLRQPAMSRGEKARALLGLLGCLVGAGRRASLEDWLARWRQHGAPRDLLWEPLCLAIMNAPPAAVAARTFLHTLRRAFLGSAARGAMWIPDKPWRDIVGEPARRTLRARGALVHLHATASALHLRDGRVDRVSCRGAGAGEVAQAWVGAARDGDGVALPLFGDDMVVSALPWHAFERLMPAAAGEGARGSEAIVSVYFELADDPPLPDQPLVALVRGEPFHFLARRPGEGRRRFALLAGGADRHLAGRSVTELAEMAARQLQSTFGFTVPDAAARTRVVKEARATLLVAPGGDARRPPPGRHRDYRNLVLCGDWCATGLPSTLEGAAASAALAIARLG